MQKYKLYDDPESLLTYPAVSGYGAFAAGDKNIPTVPAQTPGGNIRQDYQATPMTWLSLPQYEGDAEPTFRWSDAPDLSLPEFNAPTFEQAMNEPGYRFRSNQGQQAMQRSAAAQGLLRSGGTLKDILEYGQNFATQEFGGVFNRALQSYQTENQRRKDEFAPKLAGYNRKMDLEQARGLAAFQRQYDLFRTGMEASMNRERILGGLYGGGEPLRNDS